MGFDYVMSVFLLLSRCGFLIISLDVEYLFLIDFSLFSNGCSAVSCNFPVLMRRGELKVLLLCHLFQASLVYLVLSGDSTGMLVKVPKFLKFLKGPVITHVQIKMRVCQRFYIAHSLRGEPVRMFALVPRRIWFTETCCLPHKIPLHCCGQESLALSWAGNIGITVSFLWANFYLYRVEK